MSGYLLIDIAAYLVISGSIAVFWGVTLSKVRTLSFLDSIAGSFILSTAQIILTSLVLGVLLKQLFPLELFLLNVFVISTGCIFTKLSLSDAKRWFQNFGRVLRIFRQEVLSRSGPFVIMMAILTLTVIGNTVLLSVLYPPTAQDDYHYHLAFVEDIIQTGEIRNFPTTHSYTTSYPHNKELLDLWNVIYFRSDSVVELTNLTFLIFTGLIIYLQCRMFGVERKWAMISSVLPFYIPVNILLLKTTKVDLMLAAMFVAALYFLFKVNLVRKRYTESYIILALCGVSLGLILGSKSSGIVYVLVFFIIMAVFVWYSIKNNSVSEISKVYGGRFLKGILILLSGLLIWGIFWYIRSWIEWGNPLYPLAINVAGIKFPGEWSDLSPLSDITYNFFNGLGHHLIKVWRETDAWYGTFYLSDSRNSGFGSLWYVILFPSYVLLLLYSLVRKKVQKVIYVLSFVLLLLLVPANTIPNYTTFIVIAGAVSFSYVVAIVINSRVYKVLIMFGVLIMCVFNSLITLSGVHFSLDETVYRISNHNVGKVRAESVYFAESNILMNRNLNPGEIVIVGDRVWFPYALVTRYYSNDVNRLPFIDANQWIRDIQAINPRYVMVLKDFPEYDAVISNPDLFSLILKEDAGEHYLFDYTGNRENNKYNVRIVDQMELDYEGKEVAIEKIALCEFHGVYFVEIEYNDNSHIGENMSVMIYLKSGKDTYFKSCYMIPGEDQDTNICRAHLPQELDGFVQTEVRIQSTLGDIFDLYEFETVLR